MPSANWSTSLPHARSDMTDTHTHLYMKESYPLDGRQAVERSIDAGVTNLVFPAVDLPTFPDLLELADAFPDNIHIAFGVHPTELTPTWREDIEEMRRMMGDRRPVAIGEVGIDLHWDPSTEALQREAFRYQIQLASALDLPVIIHSRDALQATLEVISDVKEAQGGQLPPLIFHSFTGSADDVAAIRKVCSPWFGINGVVTFKNARELAAAVPAIGLDRILLETDSPYLSPVPWRGKRNESAHIPAIRDMVARLLGTEPSAVAEATDRNARRIFRF